MEQKKYDFGPIKLIDTSKYMPKGYRIGEITQAYYQFRKGQKVLTMEFQVASGKYKGFKITNFFYLTRRGTVRLSYLCKAVGITGKLRSPNQLIGKRVKLLVKPEKQSHMGKSYTDYKITMFHPAITEKG